MTAMLIDGGGGSSRLVGMDPDGAQRLIQLLHTAAGRSRGAAHELDRLLAAVPARLRAAGAGARALRGFADWAAATAQDARWRLDVLSAVDATAVAGLLWASPAFTDRAAARAAGRTAASELECRLGALTNELDAPEAAALRRLLDQVSWQARRDPAYAAAFVNALGAGGVLRTLRAVEGLAWVQPDDNAVADDLLRPFVTAFAAATRSRDYDARITGRLLDRDDPWDLVTANQLTWFGEHGTEFLLAVARRHLLAGFSLGLLHPYGEAYSRFHDERVGPLEALSRNPEAALAWLEEPGHARILLASHFDDGGRAAGDLIAAALIDRRQELLSAGAVQAALAADRLAEDLLVAVQAGGRVPEGVKVGLATVVASHVAEIDVAARYGWGPGGDRLGIHLGSPAEATPVLAALFTSDEATARVLAAAAVFARGELDAAAARQALTRSSEDFVTASTRVGDLFGILSRANGDALASVGRAADARAAMVVGALDLAVSTGIGAAALAAPGAGKLAALPANRLKELGLSALETAHEQAALADAEAFIDQASARLRLLVSQTYVAHGIVPTPADPVLLDGDVLAGPPRDAGLARAWSYAYGDWSEQTEVATAVWPAMETVDSRIVRQLRQFSPPGG